MALRKIAPRQKRYWPAWWANNESIIVLPRLRRQIELLIANDIGRSCRGLGPAEIRQAVEDLVKKGLCRWTRIGRGTCRYNRLEITPAGDQAIWEGRLPAAAPKPKTHRKERRSWRGRR